jgi:hypothetical protein
MESTPHLERLRVSLATAVKNTTHMMDLLDHCNSRFSALEDKMLPVQKVHPTDIHMHGYNACTLLHT